MTCSACPAAFAAGVACSACTASSRAAKRAHRRAATLDLRRHEASARWAVPLDRIPAGDTFEAIYEAARQVRADFDAAERLTA